MSSTGPNARRPRILCIDDAEVALQVRKLLFQQAGYEVTTATSGEEALDVFKREAFDVVIADHFLSNKTGTEIAREMKDLQPQIPILIVSAAAEKPPGLEFVDGFLPKGESPDMLLHAIAGLLESHNLRATK